MEQYGTKETVPADFIHRRIQFVNRNEAKQKLKVEDVSWSWRGKERSCFGRGRWTVCPILGSWKRRSQRITRTSEGKLPEGGENYWGETLRYRVWERDGGREEKYIKIHFRKNRARDTWVAQWFSVCLWLRAWSRGPGIESCIGRPAWSLLLPLPVFLSFCMSLINK